MECLIEIEEAAGYRVVRLAGRLTEAQVPELLRVCEDGALPLRLQLDNLISVDPTGLATLDRLRQRGATLIDVPTYIQLKLDALSATRQVRYR